MRALCVLLAVPGHNNISIIIHTYYSIVLRPRRARGPGDSEFTALHWQQGCKFPWPGAALACVSNNIESRRKLFNLNFFFFFIGTG